VYGRLKHYATKEEKVGAKFDEKMIQQVASEKYRRALLQRLAENNNDSKKAFTGNNALDKNPIYLNESKTLKLPEKIKIVWLECKCSQHSCCSVNCFRIP
jgi:CRISPR-associated endonuclease Csn1